MKALKALSFIIICLLPICIVAQDSHDNPDSSFSNEEIPNDTNEVNNLINLSRQNVGTDAQLAMSYAEQAQEISEAIGFKKGVALALKYRGMAYYVQANYFETINYWIMSLNMFKEIGDLNGEANMLNNVGTIYFNQGMDVKAIEYYLESLRVAEQTGNKLRILSALVNVGSVYSNKEATYNKALEYYHRALPLCIEVGDQNAIGTTTVNIGQILLNFWLKDTIQIYLDSALYYFESSLIAFEQVEGGNLPYTLNYIGSVYAQRKDYSKAITYQKQAYEIAKERNAKLEMTHSLIEIAYTYEMQGDTISALSAFKEAEEIASEINANTQLNPILEGVSRSYAALSNYKMAYKYHMLLADVKDSLYDFENTKKLERLEFNFNLETKQTEINLLVKDRELQELQIERQRIVKNAFLGGLILIFIIAFVLYRNYKIKVKSNRKLGVQKQQIENLLLNILPAKVAQELQLFGFATPRYYESASVLFTDFKGFSSIAEGLTPNQLVSELNDFFIVFDEIVEKYGLEKIKTIGDAYMCAGGLPTENDTHPLDTVKAGLEMQAYMKEKNAQREKAGMIPWALRVGIHTGPLVAGVVGRKKYAYDIWGSTVNISSRMESNGEAGKLNISASTHELIKAHYSCQYRGKINAKNIGDIDMYFVEEEIAGFKDADVIEK